MQFSIITITSFVAVLNQGTKYFATNFLKRDISKRIPIFSVVYGIILGIAGYFTPSVDMGSNLIEAIFIGIAAGSSATGVHQIYVQQKKPNGIDVSSLMDDLCESSASLDVPDETEAESEEE